MKQRIIFRSDGNSDIGLGHVIRSLALANILSDKFECLFVTRFLNEFILNEISYSCGNYIKLSEDNDDHFEEFLDLLSAKDIVVLDNYFFSTEYQIYIKSKGCKLVLIDDMCEGHFVADAVINHSPSVSADRYSKENYTKLFLGLEYALLRKSFFNLPKKARNTSALKVLVCLGGSDKYDITSRVVTLLGAHQDVSSIDVIISSSFQRKSQLEKVIASVSKDVKVFSNQSASEVAKRMQICDFGIFPASTICLEALYAGLPFMVGYSVENHKELYKTLVMKYNIQGLGNLLNLTVLPAFKNDMAQLEFFDSTSSLVSIFENFGG